MSSRSAHHRRKDIWVSKEHRVAPMRTSKSHALRRSWRSSEAHTLTAFLPGVEHAILIGDHEQLRPQINNYELQHDNPRGKRYSVDISLFERLMKPQMGNLQVPLTTLKTHVNDKDFDIVCRNFAILSIALQCPSNEAADIILHISYSARISIKASRAISTYVLPLAEAVIPKMKDKSPTTPLLAGRAKIFLI